MSEPNDGIEEKQDDKMIEILNKTEINTNVNSNFFNLSELKDKLRKKKNLIVKDNNNKFHQAVIQDRNRDYKCPKEQDNEFFKSHCIGMTLFSQENQQHRTNLMYKDKDNLTVLNLMIGDQVIIKLDNGDSYEGIFYILPNFPTGKCDVDRVSPGYACLLGKKKDVEGDSTYVIYFHDKPSKNIDAKVKSAFFVPDNLSNVRKDIVSVEITKRADNNNVLTYLEDKQVYDEDSNISSNSDKIKNHVKDNLESILSYIINYKLLEEDKKEELLDMYHDNSMKVKTSVDDVNNKLKEIYENVSPSARTVNYTWPDGIDRAPIRDIISARTTMLQKKWKLKRAKERMKERKGREGELDAAGEYDAVTHDYLDSIKNFYNTAKDMIDNGNLNTENDVLQQEAEDNLYRAENEISMVIDNENIKIVPSTGDARNKLNKARDSLEKLENKRNTVTVGQNEQEEANKRYINALKIYKKEAIKKSKDLSDLDMWFPLTEATFLEEDSKELMNDTSNVKEGDIDENPITSNSSLFNFDGLKNEEEREEVEKKKEDEVLDNVKLRGANLTGNAEDAAVEDSGVNNPEEDSGVNNPFPESPSLMDDNPIGNAEDAAVKDIAIGGKKYTKKNKSKKTNTKKQYKQIKQLKKVLKQSKKQYKKQIKQSKNH